MISVRVMVMTIIISLVLISIATESAILYSYADNALVESIGDHLTTAALSKAAEVRLFLHDQKIAIDTMAQSVVVKDLLVMEKSDPSYSAQLAKVGMRLRDTVMANQNFYSNFVVDVNGVIVSSSEPADVGVNVSDKQYFIKGKDKVYLGDPFFDSKLEKASIAFSAPILDSRKHMLGVYVGMMYTEVLRGIIAETTVLGESGEVFLIDKNRFLLTPNRGYPNPKLDFQITSVNTLKCTEDMEDYEDKRSGEVEEHENEAMFYKDYFGVPVFGSHAYISPEAEWCLIAKTNESEAIGSYRNEMMLGSTYVALFLTIFFLVFGYIISTWLTRPIKRLSGQIDSVTKGNLDVQLEKATTREFQMLTDSLNRILASMKLAILRSSLSKSELGLGEVMEAKKEVEERLRAIYEGSADALMILTPPEWKFTSGNPAAVKIFGAGTEKEFISHGPSEFSPEFQPDGSKSDVSAKKMIDKAMKEGSAYFDWVHMRLDGTTFDAKVLLSRIKIGGKEVLQANVRDESVEKAMHRKLGEFASIINNSNDAILGKTLDGTITSWNHGAEKIYGYKASEVIGKSINVIVPKELRSDVMNILQKVGKGEKIKNHITQRVRKDGKKITVSLSVSPIKDSYGKIVGASAIARPIDN